MRNILLLIFLFVLSLSSCDEKQMKSLLPSVTGNAFEVMVVTSPSVWNDTSGKAVKEMLGEYMEGMPQAEPYFNVSFLPEAEFSNLFKPVRGIVFVNVNSEAYTQPKIHFSSEKWARTQVIVTLNSPDSEGILNLVSENKDKIRRYFSDAEASRMLEMHKKSTFIEGNGLVKSTFGIDFVVPSYTGKYKKGDDFIWFSNMSMEKRQDIIIYRLPYLSVDDFKKESLISKRDSILKIYIPGPSEGSYMTTDKRFPPEMYVLNVDGRYTTELRGLWRVENDHMAGPFVSRATVDPERRNIIVCECFVYAPNKNKRNMLRSLESSLSSLSFPSVDSAEADTLKQ